MNHSERVARAVIEAVIQAAGMVYRCDQNKGLHDFDLYHKDGRVGTVEVTSSVDAPGKQTEAAILDPRKGGRRVKAVQCKWPWRIRPGRVAIIDRIRKDVDRYLAEIESQGIRLFDPAINCHNHVSVERIRRDLMIYSGNAELGESGYITMCPPIEGGFFGGSLVNEAVTLEALKLDNRRKLASADTARGISSSSSSGTITASGRCWWNQHRRRKRPRSLMRSLTLGLSVKRGPRISTLSGERAQSQLGERSGWSRRHCLIGLIPIRSRGASPTGKGSGTPFLPKYLEALLPKRAG